MNATDTRLKYVCRFQYGDALNADEKSDGAIKVFGSNGAFTSTETANTSAPVIVIGRKGSYGKINWSDRPCFASDTTFFVDSFSTINELRWLFWALQTLHLDKGNIEAAVPGLSRENAYEKRLLVPPLEVQQRIADFLDAETAQIDALILEKERMLKLLEEKRAALISHAVTKGLNPNAPMKDSGLEWLGKIPAHWELKKLKFVASVRGGVALGKQYGKTELVGYPYLRVANVQDGSLDLSDIATIYLPESEAQTCLLRVGDVLMNEGGDADKLGRGCVWNGEIEPCLHQNHVFSVRPFAVNSEWLNVWTSTHHAKTYFESRAKKSTNLASISSTNIREMPVPVPSRDEQKAVVAFLEQEEIVFSELKNSFTRSLQLLHERRSALITAAVTGQLEVQGVTA